MYSVNKKYPHLRSMNIQDSNNSDLNDDYYQPYSCPECPYLQEFNYLSSQSETSFPFNEENDNNEFDESDLTTDYGPDPIVLDIEEVTKRNNMFRSAIWTGEHLQLTLMSLKPREDIGLEIHPDVDQFIRIEQGEGLVMMGDTRDRLDFQEEVSEDYAIIIPAGQWHNVINTGNTPLKLYSIYAPPQHPAGTVQETKEDAKERQ